MSLNIITSHYISRLHIIHLAEILLLGICHLPNAPKLNLANLCLINESFSEKITWSGGDRFIDNSIIFSVYVWMFMMCVCVCVWTWEHMCLRAYMKDRWSTWGLVLACQLFCGRISVNHSCVAVPNPCPLKALSHCKFSCFLFPSPSRDMENTDIS